MGLEPLQVSKEILGFNRPPSTLGTFSAKNAEISIIRKINNFLFLFFPNYAQLNFSDQLKCSLFPQDKTLLE